MEISIVYSVTSFVFLLALLAVGVPIAFALGIVGIALGCVITGWDVVAGIISTLAYGRLGVYGFTVIPLFILMGNFAFEAGVAEDVYDIGYKWLGRLPGGIVAATMFSCGLFAAICGSSAATAATIGKISIGEMEKYRYDRKIATGAVAIGGTLGPLIPPSIVMVIIGAIGQISIGKLLIAVLLPGALLMVFFIIGSVVIALLRPKLAPVSPVTFSWRERISSLKGSWLIIVTFIVVLGGIYAGIFTPTEGAAVGSFMTFLLLALRRRTQLGKSVMRSFSDTVVTSTMIFTIILGCIVFNYSLIISGFIPWLVEIVTGLPVPPMTLLVGLLLIYLPLGMFLEVASLLIITIPIFLPIISGLGLSPIWFGVLAAAMAEIATVTPPVGINVYVVHGVAPHVPLMDIFRGVLPFLFFNFIAIGILIAFPQISLFLPGIM